MARTLALFSGLSIIGGLLLFTPQQPLSAAKRPNTVETSLLGIRILQSYNDVLVKYGPPTRIYRGGETVSLTLDFDANGNPTGGIRGLGDDTNGPMGGRGMGGPGMAGSPRMGGPPAMTGSMGGGMNPGMMMGRPGGMSSSMGSGMNPGMMGGYQGMALGGRQGMGGGMNPGMMSGSSMGGGRAGGLGASVNQGSGETFGDSGGFQWVYFYPKQELVYWFIFNTDKRVVAIIERGRYLGQKTSHGLGLGDSAKSIYNTYGWPDSLEQQGYTLALRYPVKHHVQFNILKNKVTTVAVVLSETERYFTDDNAGGAPAMGGGGRGMGMPGMAGGSRMGGMMGGPGMMMGRPGMAGGSGGKAD